MVQNFLSTNRDKRTTSKYSTIFKRILGRLLLHLLSNRNFWELGFSQKIWNQEQTSKKSVGVLSNSYSMGPGAELALASSRVLIATSRSDEVVYPLTYRLCTTYFLYIYNIPMFVGPKEARLC